MTTKDIQNLLEHRDSVKGPNRSIDTAVRNAVSNEADSITVVIGFFIGIFYNKGTN